MCSNIYSYLGNDTKIEIFLHDLFSSYSLACRRASEGGG